MHPDIVEAIGPIIALVGLGTFTLVGMKMWLTAKTERLRLQAGSEDTTRLAESVEELQDQVLGVRDELAELHERMDFAERMLAQGGDKDRRLRPPQETPV